MKKTNKINNPYYIKASNFYEKENDSSFIYFNKAKEEFLKTNDSIGIAKCLIYMAIISGDEGDYFGSQEISLSAIKYLNENIQEQREIASSNYSNLGKMSNVLKQYDDANKFYKKSIIFTKDEDSKSIYINNIGVNLSDQKRYNEALEYFEQLKNIKDSLNYSRVLTNISFNKWLQNSNYNPIPGFLKALYIRKKLNNLWGQNSSYAHLADFYTKVNSDSALFYGQKMYQVAKQLKSADDQLEALQKLIRLSPSQTSKQYFDIYQKLDDSVKTARNATKKQFALIRYETEKHKADFLKAQTENTQKQNSILKLYLAVAVLISLLIFGYLYYKRRKKRLLQEKELEVKNTELKYSKKVHDRVANKIYHVMSVVENTDELNKDNLLDDLEVIYDISRDISYEDKDHQVENDFEQQLSKLLQSYSSEKIKISTIGNEEQLWQPVNHRVKSEIYCVLQELMTNMKKHSKADNVQINFEKKDHQIFISYFDNGIGIKKEMLYNNGLTSTGNRIKSINGTINFETKVDEGLKIQIYFPIS